MNISQQDTSSICYVEIPAPSIEETTNFYKEAFNWEVKPGNFNEHNYWLFDSGDKSISGGFDSRKPVSQNAGVLLYIKVDDIDESLKHVKDAGGDVVKEKFEIHKGFGYSAVFKDPNGNQIGLKAMH